MGDDCKQHEVGQAASQKNYWEVQKQKKPVHPQQDDRLVNP